MKRQTKSFLIIAALLQSIFVNAQFGYYGYTRDCECSIIANSSSINVRASIIQGNNIMSGTEIYIETYNTGISTNGDRLYYITVESLGTLPLKYLNL